MSETMKLPPEFNSWGEVWAEHQLRGKLLSAANERAETARKLADEFGAALCQITGDTDRVVAYANAEKTVKQLTERAVRAEKRVLALCEEIDHETLPERHGAYRLVDDCHITQAIDAARREVEHGNG